MLMQKSWEKKDSFRKIGNRYRYVYTGWFLFGIIPLYVIRKSFTL